MFYSSEPEKLREFLRDQLGLRGTDVGGGWLIFDLPEADLADLRGRGAEFVDEVQDMGYGLVTHFAAPGGFQIQLYQPSYGK
jgi:hypothetical protein